MRVLGLAFQSAWARRFTLSVTVLAIALASCLLLLMERVRHDTRLSFMESVSGVDLVVGPRSGAVALVLQSVFHVGSVPHAMSWQAHESLSQHPAVAWTVPLLLGDSLRGFPVVGTSPSYIEHVRHGDQQPIALAQGRAFAAHSRRCWGMRSHADCACSWVRPSRSRMDWMRRMAWHTMTSP